MESIMARFVPQVAQNWKVDFMGSPFVEFQAKLKEAKKALSAWSKEVFGNVFHQIATIEDVIKTKETQLELYPSENNRAELRRMEAELKKFLKIEEKFWRQKAGMKWFSDGDKNTKFFHSYVKGRRKKLHISEIENDQGVKVQTNAKIGEEAVNFFAEQFKEEDMTRDFSMLDLIEKSITEEENEEMVRLPEQEEVKRVVFELNGSSACGPDGFSGLFFQSCWEIIGGDITKLVRAFFCGRDLPKYVTHTNLILLPKKELVKNFSDLRPISLSSFTNKIISRLIHDRMVAVLNHIAYK